MRTTVDLPLFLPLLESGVYIVTPGKRLAREITESWVRHCESDSPVIATPRVTTVDSWLEQAWFLATADATAGFGRLAAAHTERSGAAYRLLAHPPSSRRPACSGRLEQADDVWRRRLERPLVSLSVRR